MVRYTKVDSNGVFSVEDLSVSDVEMGFVSTKKHDRLEVFTDTKVGVNLWVPDDTYEDYPYRADIRCVGVTKNHVPAVVLGDGCFDKGFSTVCESRKNRVSLYTNVIPKEEFVIPLIICVLPEKPKSQPE